MAITIQHNDLTIEVFDDSSFTQSSDRSNLYDKIYQPDKDHEYVPASQHAIVVYKNSKKLSSAILIAVAGVTSVTEDSVIIDNNNLITRCCNIVFSLILPDLQLNWMTEVDWATCFSIHKYQDDFITQGEMSIKRINKYGKILWDYGGAEIFVTLDGSSSFDMYDNYIALRDFNGSTYKIDYNGKTISYVEAGYSKQKPVKVLLESEKLRFSKHLQIQLLQHHQIDKERWLRVIQQSPNGLIYAWPVYLDTMCPGWQALVTEDYSVVMPLTIKKKWGIRYLYQPPWCQQLGLFGTAVLTENIIQKFLQKARQHILFAEINLNFQNSVNVNTIFPRKNYVLNLGRAYQVIRSAYIKGLIKKDLERIEKYNLQYSVSQNISLAITTFREWYANRTPHVTEKDYQHFTQLCLQLQATGNAFVREVRLPNGELLACNIFLQDDRRIYYILSSTLPNGRTLGANHFLLDRLIQEFAGSGLLLDFEGSEISSIERIFQKFGSTNQPYFFTKWNYLPWPLRLLKK